MNKQAAKKRIDQLKDLISKHRYQYHVLNKQEISDAALDALKHELEELEGQYPEFITPDSPTQRVAGEPLDKFKKVEHSKRMLSLRDIFNFNELKEWEERLKKILPDTEFDYYTEIKIDGFALALIYEDSVLVTAATRGDSYVGEDVTQNVKTIESVPLRLREDIKGRVEVRGEVFMSKKEFERINKEKEKKNEDTYANPRNLAAGTIRQLDPNLAAQRKLDFFAYEIVEGIKVTSKKEEHKKLKDLGFKVVEENTLLSSIEDVQSFYEEWIEKRDKQEYLIDGLVVKINNNDVRDSLGVVGKAPRGMIAYKFPAEQTTTVVKEVEWNIGRTGVLTPLATFEPVQVAGTTVQHATLHNMDEIERLGVRVGDTVVIEKAGDIIPKVVKVLPELRTGDEEKITPPKKCPKCEGPVEKEKDGVALYCKNPDCFAIEVEGLIHFVSRQAFNIEGLGEKVIELLAHEGLIQKPADIFRLEKEELMELERFAEKSAENAVNSIDNSRTIELPRLLYALGIRHVGIETANTLAFEFGSLEGIKKASVEELEEVKDIGGVVAQSIYDYFHNEKKMEDLDELLQEIKIQKVQKKSNILEGKTIVVTGSLKEFTRDEIKEKIRLFGGDPSSSVSEKTSLVVVGENPGSKASRAKDLGVKVISEKEFIELINT